MTQQKTANKEVMTAEQYEAKLAERDAQIVALNTANKEIQNSLNIRIRSTTTATANNYHLAVDKFDKQLIKHKDLLLNYFKVSDDISTDSKNKFIDFVVSADFRVELANVLNIALELYFKSETAKAKKEEYKKAQK